MDWFLIVGTAFIGALLFEIVWVIIHSQRAVRAGKRVEPAERLVAGRSIRVLIIGDSTAYGTGASCSKFSLVGRLIQDYPQCTVVNASENAMSLARLVDKLQQMKGQSFDVVMIHIGGIDTLQFTPEKTIRLKLHEAFGYAKEMGAKMVTLVSVNNISSAAFFHTPIRQLYGFRSKRVSEVSHQVCGESDVIHVPLYTTRSIDPLRQRGFHFAPDGIHPNDQGYEIWYGMIKAAIDPKLAKLIKDHA